jgi:molybdopterin converting factor small subunit
MPVVWISSLLRELTAHQERIAVEGATVREVIESLEKRYPGIKQRICAGDSLRPGIAVMIDSEVAPLGLLQPVREQSEVHIVPAIAGG